MPQGADTFLLELFAIFVWAKAFAELFEQLSLPAVLGEILAGVVLGPHLTALVIPSDTVESIAEVGAIFLLFTVGLETRPGDLIKVGRQSIRVAVAGVVYAVAQPALWLTLPLTLALAGAYTLALFLGGILTPRDIRVARSSLANLVARRANPR